MISRRWEWQDDRPPGVIAWLVSLAFHACLLIGLAATTSSPAIRGVPQDLLMRLAGDEPLVADEEQDALSGLLADDVWPPSDFVALPAADEASLAPAPPPLPMWGRLGAEAGSSATQASAGDDRGRAPGPGRLGGDARVTVFGVEGVGTKFVFVFDRSTSMAGIPLAAAKQQLLAGLDALESVHQFHVIFFNHEMQNWDVTGGQNRIPFASDANKELARRFVNRVTAAGGTSRRAPLLHALAMSPDCVFFLTDADDAMPAYDVAEAARRAQRSGTAIACIEFGAGPAQRRENFLTRLARETGGQYVYADTTTLAAGRARSPPP
jgi:hypothetical protein